MNRRHSLFGARALAAVVAGVLAAVVIPAGPAPAASSVKISKSFWGMHDSRPETWPKTKVTALRLWDAGVTWRQIETTPGAYDFTRLDALVAAGRAHGAEITLTLGQTPSFRTSGTVRPSCESAPTNPLCSRFGTGASSVPNTTAWVSYVNAVAERYAGRIANLQVWNEGNVPGYWAGSAGQLASLTYLTRAVVNGVNSRLGSHIKLIAPSFVGRSNTDFISSFYKSKPHGKKVAKYVDAAAFSLYPSASGGPEDSMKILKSMKKILKKRKAKLPVWNTEINYGLAAGGTGKKPPTISKKRQAAYVVRTYLLNADAHVGRVFWYSWDLHSIGNTLLTKGSADSVTRAGKAYALTQSWLAGSKFKGCSKLSNGAYVCTAKYKHGVKRIYWHPTKRVRMTMPGSATYTISVTGKKTKFKGGSKKIDYRPVLVRSKR